MVEETIRSIRETERQADGIVKQAEEKSRMIREETKAQAEKLAGEVIADARAKSLEAAENAKDSGDRAETEAMAETEKEIRELKASAMKRQAEAVDLVISLLA